VKQIYVESYYRSGYNRCMKKLNDILNHPRQKVIEERIKIIEFFDEYGDQTTKKAFGKSRSTVYLWKRRLKESGGRLSSLCPGDKAPKRKRSRLIDPFIEGFIISYRTLHPGVDKATITPVLKEICEKTGHLEVAMSQLGQVLIYAPPDPDGLWIHKTVAEALNAKNSEEMRSGFSTGVFNSRGVVWVDPSGKPEDELAAKYNAKGDEVEAAGFHRLAVAMRSLAGTYSREAERIRKEHSVEEEAEAGDDAQQGAAPLPPAPRTGPSEGAR